MRRIFFLSLISIISSLSLAQEDDLPKVLSVGFGPMFPINSSTDIDTSNILNYRNIGFSANVKMEYFINKDIALIFDFNGFDSSIDSTKIWDSFYDPIDRDNYYVTNSSLENGFVNSLQFSVGVSRSFNINEKLKIEPYGLVGINLSNFYSEISITLKEKGTNYWIEKNITSDRKFSIYPLFTGGLSIKSQIIKVNGTYIGLFINSAYYSTKSKASLISNSIDIIGDQTEDEKYFTKQSSGIIINIGGYWNF